MNQNLNIENVLSRHYSSKRNSNIQYVYLSKILDLTKKYNVKLNLITLPLHSRYYKNIPWLYAQMHKRETNRFKKIENVKYLDLSFLKLKDEHFKDYDHLNMKGAKLVSELIGKM